MKKQTNKRLAIAAVTILIAFLMVYYLVRPRSGEGAMTVIEVYLLMKVPGAEYMIITSEGGKKEMIYDMKNIEDKIHGLSLSPPVKNYFVLGDLQSFSLELRGTFQSLSKKIASLNGKIYFVNRLLVSPLEQCVFVTSQNGSGYYRWFTVNHSRATVDWSDGNIADVAYYIEKLPNPGVCIAATISKKEVALRNLKGVRVYLATETPNYKVPFTQYPSQGDVKKEKEPDDPFILKE